jgi:hypothetical protein
MQGAYRILGESEDLVESFVAAPGPAGWRYFGRGRHGDTGEELFKVDYIVDAGWDLVRFRAIYGGGLEAVAVPVPGGLEVSVGQPGEERTEEIAGVSAVWSASPCSLLVVDRQLRACGQDELAAVRLKPPDEPEAVTVRLDRRGSQGITTPAGSATAERVDVIVDGWRTKALIRPDLPLSAEGWFELIE